MNVSDPKHPHHAVWREHVQSVLDGAPKFVEYRSNICEWCVVDIGTTGFVDLSWRENCQYRIARPTVTRTITRTITYPAPMTVAPELTSSYWTIEASENDTVLRHTWAGCRFDMNIFASGMCWATEADAIEAAKAIFGGKV